MYFCRDCQEVFAEGRLERVPLVQIEGEHYLYEYISICPACGSDDIVESRTCPGCGREFDGDMLEDGFCPECLRYLRLELRAFLNGLKPEEAAYVREHCDEL